MMTSFLVKERTKETYLQKISSEPQGTQQNRIVTINNFERFVSELYEEKTIESVIEELKILKKTEEERYLDALYDLLQEWINWNTEQEIESSTQRTFFSYLRNYLYYRGIKTNQQDIKENLKFGKKIHVERHPLSQEEYRMIIGAIFIHANLFRTYFRYASLVKTDFLFASMVRLNFEGADLRNATINGAYLADVSFMGANLLNTDMFRLWDVDISDEQYEDFKKRGAKI